MAINLAKAYVEIIPSTQGLGRAIKQSMSQMDSESKKAGAKAGENLKTGISSRLKSAGIGGKILSSASAKLAGTKAGQAITGGTTSSNRHNTCQKPC